MGKIILTLLAIVVCTEATFNVGPLLGLLRPPPPRVALPAPVPAYPAAPVQPGYASYYRQAPKVVQAAPQPVVFVQRPAAVASYYRQPVATPQVTSIVIPPAVHTTSTVLSTSFTGQHEPLSFTSFGSQQPLSFTEFEYKIPEPDISIVPSHSLSFSFADSSASSGGTGSGYSVETVKSEGHSYSLTPEQITVEKTIAPITTIETTGQFQDTAEPETYNFDFQQLSLRVPEEPQDVKVVSDRPAKVKVDKAVKTPTRVVLETTEEPVKPIAASVVTEIPEITKVDEVTEVAQVAVQDQKTEIRFQAEEQPKPQVQQQIPQAIAAVQLNQAEITEQILKQAIPNVVNQVSGHIIQQAIPLVVDRAVPQVVYQVGSTVAQQAYKQTEPVQIVTPLNTHHQHQHQKQNEKVFVMYATSAGNNQQFENVFNNQNQHDVSENLVVPIGNRNQHQQQHQHQHQHQQQQQHQHQQQSSFQITRGIQAGSDTQEQRQNSAYFNQQIVSNFQRENALHRQNSGQLHQHGDGQGATFEQIQQAYPGLLSPRNKRKPDA